MTEREAALKELDEAMLDAAAAEEESNGAAAACRAASERLDNRRSAEDKARTRMSTALSNYRGAVLREALKQHFQNSVATQDANL